MILRLLFPLLFLAAPLAAQPTAPATALDWLRLPADGITFIENLGQWDAEVRFLAHLDGTDLWVTDDGLIVDFYQVETVARETLSLDFAEASERDPVRRRGRAVKLRFEGGRAQRIEGRGRRSAYHNYFLGDDPARWAPRVPLYDEVVLHDVYDGVALRLYAAAGTLRHDFVFAPGADPAPVRVRLDGADPLGERERLDRPTVLGLPSSRLDGLSGGSGRGGNLVYSTYLGGGAKDRARTVEVDADGIVHLAGRTLSADFRPVGAYDSTYAGGFGDAFIAKLDPAAGSGGLIYATYLGGSGFDEIRDLALGTEQTVGTLYVTGITASEDFPLAQAIQPEHNLGTDRVFGDAFIARLSTDGTMLERSTYLGGNFNDGGRSITLDSEGRVYVTGITISARGGDNSPFETLIGGSGNPYQSTYQDDGRDRVADAFLVQLDPDMTAITYGTFLGGFFFEEPKDLVVVDDETVTGDVPNVYIVGTTGTDQGATNPLFTNSAALANAYQDDNPAAGLTDPREPDNLTIRSAFVAVLTLGNNGPDDLSYATYLGGTQYDGACGLALHDEKIYVGGYTRSTNLFADADPAVLFDATYAGPTPGDSRDFGGDLFVAVLDPTVGGSGALTYGTYLGGTGSEESGERGAPGVPLPFCGFDVDADGSVYLAGATASTDFPIAGGGQALGGATDALFVQLYPNQDDGTDLCYSTYLGGSDHDEALRLALAGDRVYVVGETESTEDDGFPLVGAYNGIYSGGSGIDFKNIAGDGFVTGFQIDQRPVRGDSLPDLGDGFTGTRTFDLGDVFSDANGSPLTFRVQSVVPAGVVSAAIQNGVLSVRALREGEATVVVSAADGCTPAITDALRVTVPNLAPTVPMPIADQGIGNSGLDVNLTNVFNDPEGRPLNYSVEIDPVGVVEASISGAILTVSVFAAVSGDQADLTVTAEDDAGQTATSTFTLTVTEGNLPPRVVATIPSDTLTAGGFPLELTLSDFFDDPDDDDLVFTAAASSSSVSVTVAGDSLTVRVPMSASPDAVGTVTVTATDGVNPPVPTSFSVTVNLSPITTGVLQPLALAPGGFPARIDLTDPPAFTDSDGDPLTFSCAPLSTPALTATCTSDGRTLLVTPGRQEEDARVVVTAADGVGGIGRDTVEVSVVNTPPRLVDTIDPPPLFLGGPPFPRDLTKIFEDDDDGQQLLFTCVLKPDASADVTVACTGTSGRILTVTPGSEPGDARITVTADDQFGGTVSTTFEIQVQETDTVYQARLRGLNVVPPSNSQAIGTITATLDEDTLRVGGAFSSDLEGSLGEAQLRIGAAGVAGDTLRTLTPQSENPIVFDEADNTFLLDDDERNTLFGQRLYVLLTNTEGTFSVRGQLLPEEGQRAPTASAITAPPDGAEVEVGEGQNDLVVTWTEATDPDANRVAYVWQLARNDQAFGDPIRSFSTGSQRSLSLPSDTLLSLLPTGEDEVVWSHRVVSTDGSMPTLGDPLALTLRRRLNAAPVSNGFRDTTLTVEQSYQINLNDHFEDDDALQYSLACSPTPDCLAPPVTAIRVDSLLTLIGVSPTESEGETIRITASDSVNDPVSDSFVVRVVPQNMPPRGSLPPQRLRSGDEPLTIDLDDAFLDDDGTITAFECASSDPSIASASTCEDRVLTVTPGTVSTTQGATISVTATDDDMAEGETTFAVTVDPALPLIAFGPITVSPSQPQVGMPVDVEAEVNNLVDGGDVFLNYRAGISSSFSEAEMREEGGVYTATIPGSVITSEGVQYFVEAQNPAGGPERTDRRSLSVGVPQLAYGQPLPSGNAQTGYRLISVPLALDDARAAAVFDEFGEADDEVWRLFELLPPGAAGDESADGADGQAYREGPDGISLTPGKAVWLIARDGGTFDTGTGSTALINEAFSMPLNGAWNLVGSPFNFDVPVGQVRLESGAEAQLQTYSGSWQNVTSAMEPFTGYALFVPADEDRLVVDPSPDPARPALAKAGEDEAASREPAWSVRIAAAVQQARDDNNLALVAPAAADGHDALDWHEPPPIGEYVSVSFAAPDGGAPFTVDARPVTEDGAAWPLVVRSNIRDEVALSFERLGDVPPAFVVWLVDEAAGTVTDLRRDPSYAFASHGSGGAARMQLIVGTEAFAQAASGFDGTVPADFQLAQNYPNPFQGVTTIQYGLPTDQHVLLEVFDLLGRRIAVLVDEAREAGYHKAVWTGRRSPSGLASGVYLYRLRAGSFTATERMVVVR